MDNELRIPYINPIKFVKVGRTNLAKYFTKHLDDYLFAERRLPWDQPEDYAQIWQADDIINLQFMSTFDPLIVQLLNKYNQPVITLPALIGLPNKWNPGFFAFEVQMALSGIPTGCYRLRITAGSGSGTEYYISDLQHISSEPYDYPNLLLEYWHPRYHEDVLFESGIKFQYRLPGHLGKLKVYTKNEASRDEYYNNTILSSRTGRQFPCYLCDENGMPEDVLDTMNRIWTCRNINIDGSPFGAVDGTFNTPQVPGYPKMGINLLVEPGINRRSSIYIQNTDTTQKLSSAVMVDTKVFGDLSNQGSTNAVPVWNIE